MLFVRVRWLVGKTNQAESLPLIAAARPLPLRPIVPSLRGESGGQGRLQGSRVAPQLGRFLGELGFALLFPFRIEWTKLQLLRQQIYIVAKSHRRASAGRARRVPDVDLHLSSISNGLAHARGICNGRPGKVVGKNRAKTDSVRSRLQISPKTRGIRLTANGRAGEDGCRYQRRAQASSDSEAMTTLY